MYGTQRGLRFSTNATLPSRRSGHSVCSRSASRRRRGLRADPPRGSARSACFESARAVGECWLIIARELARPRQDLVRRQHLAHQAELQGLLRRHPLGAAEQRHMRSTASSGMRRARPTGSRPAIRPTFTWVSKKVACLRADDQVAVGDEVQPAAADHAVHRGDRPASSSGSGSPSCAGATAGSSSSRGAVAEGGARRPRRPRPCRCRRPSRRHRSRSTHTTSGSDFTAVPRRPQLASPSSRVKALWRSGRFRVIVATPSPTS